MPSTYSFSKHRFEMLSSLIVCWFLGHFGDDKIFGELFVVLAEILNQLVAMQVVQSFN